MNQNKIYRTIELLILAVFTIVSITLFIKYIIL
jgi:hypothetical protein